MGRHRTPRTLRPDPHLEPPPPRTAPPRVRRALQHAPTAPQPRPTRTRHARSRRVPARPPDPTTPHLQRTHQPVPPSSLNPRQRPTPHELCLTSTRPLPTPRSDIKHRGWSPTAERVSGTHRPEKGRARSYNSARAT